MSELKVLNQCQKCNLPFWHDHQVSTTLCQCVYVANDVQVHEKMLAQEKRISELEDKVKELEGKLIKWKEYGIAQKELIENQKEIIKTLENS